MRDYFHPRLFSPSLLIDEHLCWRILIQLRGSVMPFWVSNESRGRQIREALAFVIHSSPPPSPPCGEQDKLRLTLPTAFLGVGAHLCLSSRRCEIFTLPAIYMPISPEKRPCIPLRDNVSEQESGDHQVGRTIIMQAHLLRTR